MEMKYFAIGFIWLGVGLSGIKKENTGTAFFAMLATIFVAMS